MPAIDLSDERYYEIEEALASTPVGRAFLRKRDRMQRVVGADLVRRLTMATREWVERRLEHGGGAHLAILRRELQEMGAYIQRTREELASLRAQEPETGAGAGGINLATEELDEVVRSTERATSDILNAAERIIELAGAEATPAAARQIGEQATEIMTACSFQDLTGQRITKVVNTLRYLERRVNAMIQIWGVDDRVAPVAAEADGRPDAHLLNGPARAGEGRSQAEIDAILNGVGAGGDVLSDAAAPGPTLAAGSAATQADIDRLFN